LARDYERKTEHAEAMIKVAMIRLMAARLTGRHIEPHGPIETEAARRLADDLDADSSRSVTQHPLSPRHAPASSRRGLAGLRQVACPHRYGRSLRHR
jgi:hypothetical protein